MTLPSGSPPTAAASEAVRTSAPAVLKMVEDQLAEERSTKSSLETRAIAVITSSGALVTLLFALAALVTKPAEYELPQVARVVLLLTVVAFISAAVLAIVAASPGTYQEITVESLRAATTETAMGAPAAQGESRIAQVLVEIISTARTKNAGKARYLKAAVTIEAIAAVLLAVAIVIVLLRS